MSSNTTLYYDLTLEKITERRINIDKYLPLALVQHNYRTRGVEKILESSTGNKCRALSFVHPIILKNVAKESVQLYEDRVLSGFLIEIEILPNKYINCLALKNFKTDTASN